MTQEAQANEARPGDSLGRAVFVLRITKPDGTQRDVEVEADIHAAKLELNALDQSQDCGGCEGCDSDQGVS